MQHTIKLFPTVVYKNFYDKFKEIEDTLFPKLQELFNDTQSRNNVFMKQGTICSYHTYPDLHQRFKEDTADVVAFVEQCAIEYWNQCGYYQELTPFVYQMWANKTPQGGYVDSHLHGNMPFTAVLYIKASPDQGNLFLENPMDTVLMTQPIGPNVKYPIGEEISVNSGDLVMFPGYIKHSVKPNTSTEDRLVLAFNIASKGRYWSAQWDHNV
jgi:uncharacterized protein (TIGR02466 family)